MPRKHKGVFLINLSLNPVAVAYQYARSPRDFMVQSPTLPDWAEPTPVERALVDRIVYATGRLALLQAEQHLVLKIDFLCLL